MAAPDIALLNATYSGVKGVTLPKSGGGTATFPWVEGSETKTANGTYDVTNLAQLVVNVSGGGGSGLTLLGTTSLGAISTSSTSAADTGKTVTATGASAYDLLVVIVSCTKTNSRHWATIGLIELYNSTDASSTASSSISGNKYNYKVGSTGTVQSRCGTTAYGIYPNSCTWSSGKATITLYQRYNSTSTGTINGTYTAKVYGIKLQDLLGS